MVHLAFVARAAHETETAARANADDPRKPTHVLLRHPAAAGRAAGRRDGVVVALNDDRGRRRRRRDGRDRHLSYDFALRSAGLEELAAAHLVIHRRAPTNKKENPAMPLYYP